MKQDQPEASVEFSDPETSVVASGCSIVIHVR